MEEHQPKYRYKGDIMTALDLHTQDWDETKLHVSRIVNFADCIYDVSQALGEYVDDFGVEAIARRIWHWNPQEGAFISTVTPDEFWTIVDEHDNTLK